MAPAHAQGTASPSSPETANDDQREAREAFREASRLAERDDWTGALAHYSISHARYPHATTLYNIGYCHERLGNPAAAVRDTRAALGFEDRFPGRGLSDELRSRATVALQELETKVATLEVVSPRTAFELGVDGRGLETLVEGGRLFGFATNDAGHSLTPVSGTVLITLNPGPHALAWKDETGTSTRRLVLGAGSRERFTFPEVAPTASTPATKPSSTPTPGVRPALAASAPEPTSTTRLRPFGHAAFVAAGAATVTGVVAGWLALESKRELDEHCNDDGLCDAGQEDRIARFHTEATVATIALTSAAVLAGTGITLLLLDSPSSQRAALELRVSSDVVLTGRF